MDDDFEDEQQRDEVAANERFVRWQKIAITQLGYTLNLVLTFTIAALAYAFSLLKDNDFKPPSSARCTLLLAFISLAVAAISGLACVLNRLQDFQGTARRLRSRPDAPSSRELRVMGSRTWVLFYAQLSFFLLGILALAVTLLLTYGGKLA
jgi:hypothetical protein